MRNTLLISFIVIIIFGVITYFIAKYIVDKNDKKNEQKRKECQQKCNFDNELTICMSINSPEESLKCRQELKVKMDECELQCLSRRN